MTDTANLGLPCIEGSQAQKHVTHNDALRMLDTLVQLAVLDRDLTAPPGAPTDGQRWIVKAGATDLWTGHDNAIAAWQDGAWQFCAPQLGWIAYVVDESVLLAWNGSDWVSAVDALTPTALNNMTLLGVGATADTTNPFSAKLNNTLFTAKTVAEGGDGDLRYKMSKEAAANTLSLLFQDAYSGRAEIGLTGDDDLHFKVSADGATWRDAIVIDKSSGSVSMPNTSGSSSDIDLTLAELTLGVADALNTAQFIGSAGNRFADSFDVLTYVDTGGATNLDTGMAGVLKPATTTSLYSVSAYIGDMSDGGALSVAFDGGTSASFSSGNCARKLSVASVYIGADFHVSGKSVGSVVIYGSNDAGFSAGANSVTAVVRGKNGSAPSSGTDGTSIGSLTFTDSGGDESGGRTIVITDQSTVYDYVWVDLSTGAATNWQVAEVKIYSGAAASDLTVTSTALTAASAPSIVKLVARTTEIDSIMLNTDLVFSVSRDGGTTWTAFTMTKKFTANSISVYESDGPDISGQPSGTAVKWKVTSANNKNFELNDIYLYWS